MNLMRSSSWRLYERAAALGLAVLYAVGAAGHVMAPTLPWMLRMTPGFLLATAVLATVPSAAYGGVRFLTWLAGACALTFAAEAVGVATGLVFGEYEYGATLGPAWRGVPLIIAFNWVVVVNGTVWMATRLTAGSPAAGRRWKIALWAGLAAMLFDVLMEPVAMRLDYWRWPGDTVPLQNYAAWFAIAALAAAAHPLSGRASGRVPEGEGRLAGFFVLVQAAFFAALRVIWLFQGG
ncbi:MAG: carotenoid biosynthesis protein [Opitutae bacterium]|nr:carotenoid biosynthesis protein [Kiritimatiellia bacterium]NCC92788.1 carotenoid biosynthesis protein [Opitutae bacterium]